MSTLRWCGSPRRPQVALGVALMGLAFTPSASAAPPLDMVTATGSGGSFSNINISAQSGTSGQNPSGSVSFLFAGQIPVSGPVTCLSVTGPDRGGGTPTAPTTAILNYEDTTFLHQIESLELVDNGGNGADTILLFGVSPPRAPTDCSPPTGQTLPPTSLTNGRAIVFDAPVLPTSKEQCKNGGWRNFPQFKNQGDCVSFVENGK